MSYDPDFDIQSYPSDWEYYSDEFFDELPSVPRKRKLEHGVFVQDSEASGQARACQNRPKIHVKRDVPTLPCKETTLQGPTVLWKSNLETLQKSLGDGQPTEPVALLKDWRKRFKISTRSIEACTPSPVPIQEERRVSQQMIEQIEGSKRADADGGRLENGDVAISPTLHSRRREPPTHLHSTLSILYEQSTKPEKPLHEPQKRKASAEGVDQDLEVFKASKKINTSSMNQKGAQDKSIDSLESLPRSTRTAKKRKAESTEYEPSNPPRKNPTRRKQKETVSR